MRAVVAIALLGLAGSARAQGVDTATTTSTAPSALDQLSEQLLTGTSTDPGMNVTVTGNRGVLAPRGWSMGRERPFFALTVDLGYLYLRPRISLGYGKPHAQWIGFDANPIFSGGGIGGYGGVRAALPFVDIRFGARGYYSFERSFLDAQDEFDRLALAVRTDEHSTYLTWESELTTTIAIGPGELNALASVSSIQGVPEGKYVYEETLHIIVKPPWVWRARAGYSLLFPIRGARSSIGVVLDTLYIPGRNQDVWRGGFVFRVAISQQLEVRGTFVATIENSDSIGILGGDFTELGLRWRWATGMEDGGDDD